MIKSPVASRHPLEPVTLDSGLSAYRCPETGGHWIPAENFWKWQQSSHTSTTAPAPTEAPIHSREFDGVVKLCPATGTIMTRYRIGHGLDFRVDRSITGGIWLDSGEWEALRDSDLHRELHLIFTTPWQKAVIQQEQQDSYADMLRGHLGDALFDQLGAVREKLRDHPARAEAIAYLQSQY